MVTEALWVRLEAKPGKEMEVESFLRAGLSVVEDEPATTAWFALRWDQTPLVSSTRSQTKRAERRISRAESLRP